MKLIVTIREIIDAGGWGAYADDKGYDIWAVVHGKLSELDKVEIDVQDAKRYGFRFPV